MRLNSRVSSEFTGASESLAPTVHDRYDETDDEETPTEDTSSAFAPFPSPSRLFKPSNTTSSIYGDISIYVSVVYMRWKIKIEVPDYSGSAHRFSVRQVNVLSNGYILFVHSLPLRFLFLACNL